mgnify:CR=1 FL=1
MKIRLYSKGGETVVKYAQKKSTKFVKIVNTSLCVHDTIINVKTPQYIIYFLLHPIISEIPSPKRTAPAVLCTAYREIQGQNDDVVEIY